MEFIGSYEVISIVSETANTMEYLGTDGAKHVTIRRLHSHLADDPVVFTRFLREAEAVERLEHRHVVRVLEVIRDPRAPAIVYEHADGGTLRDRIPVDIRTAIDIADSVAGALAFAHGAGIVHRDIRPENIGFYNDRIKIGGFGLAHVDDLVGLTTSTLLSSNAAYLAPEISQGISRDPRSDLYSLGVVIRESLIGENPLTGYRTGQPSIETLGVEKSMSWFTELIKALLRPLDERIASASEVLFWISRKHGTPGHHERYCVHCRLTTPAHLPICVHCGGDDIYAEIITDGTGDALVLRKLSEEDVVFDDFLFLLRCLSGDNDLRVNILTGDIRMYSRAEKAAGHRLPVRIADNLTTESAARLAKVFGRSGSSRIHVYRRPMKELRKREKRGPLIEPRVRPPFGSEDIAMLRKQLRLPAATGAPAETVVPAVIGGRDRGVSNDGPVVGLYREIVDSGYALRGRLIEIQAGSDLVAVVDSIIAQSAKLLAECDRVHALISDVDLPEIYNGICEYDRLIRSSSNVSETDGYIRRKAELLALYDEYRKRERVLARLVSRLGNTRHIVARAVVDVGSGDAESVAARIIELGEEAKNAAGGREASPTA